ncbi:MAG: hypothetical protein FKY71_14730 [Spiribacter salinus]|uniref:Uncharacterized protein n=1 Tax=Spiribacter salinus TaxID=1335746 RepID=A0A540VNI1_9GAMM|nr:MAG: hypothetical protein FKY71_14730 [Spiribacter salinus]
MTEEERRCIGELAKKYGGDDPDRAEQAIQQAVNIGRHASNFAKVTQGEYRAIYEEQARRAAALLEFVRPSVVDGRVGAGDRMYTDLFFADSDSLTPEELEQDPLFKNRRVLAELLELIDRRSQKLADECKPKQYRRNKAQHEIASALMFYAKSGVIAVTPSASKTSRLAALYQEASQLAGLEPGDPSEYLKGK